MVGGPFVGYLGGMDWQQLISLVIVAAAAALMARGAFARKRRTSACGGGCGCSGGAKPENQVFRARKARHPGAAS